MKNIYADHGGIIERRYISRRDLEAIATSRLLDEINYGSMSVVGLQRTGKSSFAHNLLEKRQDELVKFKTLIVKLDMSLFNKPETFFKAILVKTFDKLEENELVDRLIDIKFNRACSGSIVEDGGQPFFSFFMAVKGRGIKIIIILDEFDNARTIFKDYKDGFNILRNLAYDPEHKVALLILSRRTVPEIQFKTAGTSTFDNILLFKYIAPYKEEEVLSYFNKLEDLGVKVDNHMIEKYKEITGFLPYWMDIISFHLVEKHILGQPIDIDEIYSENQVSFYNLYAKLSELLEEQGLLDKLYQLRFGPIHDATKDDCSHLVNYGVILVDKELSMFSRSYEEYLWLCRDKVDFYPLWNQTEKKIRALAFDVFKSKYGDNWEEKLVNKYQGNLRLNKFLSNSINEVKKIKRSRYFNRDVKLNFLDGITTGGLFELISNEWMLFEKVFQFSKEIWIEKTKHITNARNPYQHNNDHLMNSSFKNLTKAYCEEISQIIDSFYANADIC